VIEMAKERRPAPPKPAPPEASASTGPGNDWDDPYGPRVPDAPAGESLPPRAAKLPSQNGQAMRYAFAYLLDEDQPAPPPPPAPSKKRR
jgi:hypothetical protein